MIHGRKDYQRIQDPDELIPEDEPVFLIRAQDVTAPEVLEHYAYRAGLVGVEEDAVREHAELMRKWQRDHGAKVPDVPE